MNNYNINAAWESREGRAICRWFIAWKDLGGNQIAGAIGGYCGGGSFLVERFYATYDNDALSSLWIDLTDCVTQEEVEFDTLDSIILNAANDAEDEIWSWNNQDAWFDDEQLLLDEGKESSLEATGDMLYLPTSQSPFLQEICELAGLTAGPVA